MDIEQWVNCDKAKLPERLFHPVLSTWQLFLLR